jgi:hypothetical protein
LRVGGSAADAPYPRLDAPLSVTSSPLKHMHFDAQLLQLRHIPAAFRYVTRNFY